MNPFRMKILVVAVFAFSLATLAAATSLAEGVGMVTGSSRGTYIQFGRDMAKFAEPEGLTIDVKESAGSLANIERIMSSENAAFGIVQADVLSFMKRKPKLQSTARNLRVIFPFYLEEVHVLARKEITSLRDLDGKRVSIGRDGSGVWLTARNILKLLGIDLALEEHLDTNEAIKRVLSDDLDAMFYVAGAPTGAFEPLERMKKSGRQDIQQLLEEVHFVPITEPEIFGDVYDRATLGPEQYPWMPAEVETAAVRAILVSYDFSSGRSSYYRERCRQLGILGRAIRKNLNRLQSGEGHPKWTEVKLDTPVSQWKQDTCSRASVAPSRQPKGTRNGSGLMEELVPFFD
jgi:TRAP transporter TAXI family solute receptor